MSQIPPRMRAVLKAAVNRFLNETCTITQDNITIDEYGASVTVTQIVAVSTPCRLISASGTDTRVGARIIGDQETMQDTYRLIALSGTPFAVNQQATVGGVVYQVIALVTGLTDDLYESAIVRRYRQ